MQMTRFLIGRDINGIPAYDLQNSNSKFSTVLTATIEQTLTIPQTNDPIYPRVAYIIVAQPGTSVWSALNDSAALPGPSFAPTTSEQNAQVRTANPGDILHLITRSPTSEVGVVFYAAQ
jgi:hypothetical protein